MRNLFLASATAATVLSGLGASLAVPSAAFAQAGSFQGSCRNTTSSNGMLTAECADAGGNFRFSSLPYTQCKGDIGNNNGMLVCNGATSSGGNIVGGRGGNNNNNNNSNNDRNNNNYGRGGFNGGQNGYNDRNNNDRGRDSNDNNAAGAAAAGLFAGALLGGALSGNGPPPPPPPAYGDARYGNPRYDWRYQQGGYGYGRRQGEWIPIRDRADWLNRQIDRLQRDGSIDFSDTRDYRRQLSSIVNRENDYMRVGRLGPRERDDLDRRFNGLTDEIRRDARDN